MVEVDDSMGKAAGERTGLPPEVEEVLGEFRTCELSTPARDGEPSPR